jgi:hypothetical protein
MRVLAHLLRHPIPGSQTGLRVVNCGRTHTLSLDDLLWAFKRHVCKLADTQLPGRPRDRLHLNQSMPTLVIDSYDVVLQLRRAISIQAEGIRLLEKHAIAPSAASAC